MSRRAGAQGDPGNRVRRRTMAKWPPAAVTIREPEDKCDRQRGDSQRLRQANAFMANAMAPDRQPASTANDSQEERGASHCCCDPRATQTAGFAGSRYRSRWRSIKFTRPLRAHGSVSTCTQGRASDGLDSAARFGGEAGEMTCETAPHLAVTRAPSAGSPLVLRPAATVGACYWTTSRAREWRRRETCSGENGHSSVGDRT